MAASYAEFKKTYLGSRVDVDGFPPKQPYQCWDLVSGVFFPYIGGKVINCRKTGYVIDIFTDRKTNGLLDFCIDVGLKETLQPGDICIWGKTPHTPYTHIAIYDSDNGQDCVYFLGQNQPNAKTEITRIPVQGIVGVFRPKVFINQKVTKPKTKEPDQILTVGSKVQSYGFFVERMDYKKKRFYNSWVGGWVPWAHVNEVDTHDGKKDNIIHVGSGVAFPGTMTVGAINIKNQTAYIKELGYTVKSRCLREIKDGK